MVKNSTHGKVWYGLHILPGVAQYSESEKNPQRIFLNEDTLRKMDKTFQGKPVFVEHVDSVNPKLDTLRKEADGWVVESFYNSADGKHWVKFITVTDFAESAIRNGARLSNAYVPVLSGHGGVWNAVPYQNEVVGGEYEHLAIVMEPRYEESRILTPEQYKAYNETKQTELKKIANAKGNTSMISKLKFWNRKPVEGDYGNLSVTLPKSGKEYSIEKLVNTVDEYEEQKKREKAEDKEAFGNKKKNADMEPRDSHGEFEKENADGEDHSMKKLHEAHKSIEEKLDHLSHFLEKNHGYKGHKKENREMDSEIDLDLMHEPIDVEGDLKNEDEMESAVISEHESEMKSGAGRSEGEKLRAKNKHKNAESQDRQGSRDKLSEPLVFPSQSKLKKNDPYDTPHDKEEDVEEREHERHMKMQNTKAVPSHFNDLKNAPYTVKNKASQPDFGQLARGKARYGSRN